MQCDHIFRIVLNSIAFARVFGMIASEENAGRRGENNMNRISKSATLIITTTKIAAAAGKSGTSMGSQSEPLVLLLKRDRRMKVAANFHVFPGGKWDERVDESPRWRQILCSSSSSSITMPADLGLRICAIRETFEETGLLLARPAQASTASDWLMAGANAQLTTWLARVRHEPHAFELMFDALRLVPCVHALQPWSRWITPSHEPRRFDTIFYLWSAIDLAAAQPHTRIDSDEIDQLQVGVVLSSSCRPAYLAY